MRHKALLIALCLLALTVSARRAAAAEEIPGNSCAGNPANAFIWAGAPENGGVLNGMFCNTNWAGIITFKSSGNVGIGTTSPSYVLDVVGNIRASTSFYAGSNITAGNYTVSANYYGGTSASNNLTLDSTTSATKGYVIIAPSTGNVGIGNTAPGALLDIGKAGTTLGTLRLEGNTSGYVQIQPLAAAGSWTMTLPPDDGTSGQQLTTDGNGVLSWAAAGSGGPLSGITAATATNTIANANYAQTWNWDTLAGASALKLASTSTAAAGNAQKMLEIALSGANGTATQTTYGAYLTNTHTGATSTNVGLYASASGGTNNYAAVFPAGNVGIGTTAPGSLLDVGLAGTTLGTLRLEGNTSGYVQIQPLAAAGSWTMTLPPAAGTAGQQLTTDGAGVLSWAAAGGAASCAPPQFIPRGPRGGSWWGIASSSDGTKLAVVDHTAYIWTSTDSGVTWTQQTGSGARYWRSIASSSDGTKLAATTNASSYIYTSTDSGVTWTQRATAQDWFGIASSSDGTKLVAVGGGYFYTSTDSGATWTQHGPGGINGWGVASSSDGTKLVAAGNAGGKLYTSTDSGVTWTARDSNRNWTGVASSSDGTKLAATVSGGYIYTSTDSGVTWTQQTGSGSRAWYWITSSSDGTHLAATDNNGNGQIWLSTDSGVTWSPQTSGGYWGWIASSSDGLKLAATDIGNLIYTWVGCN